MSAPQVGDVITTVEGLDALSRAAVVADTAGLPYIRGALSWHTITGYAPSSKLANGQSLTILYLPGQPPRPERAVKAEALREAADGIQALHPGEVKRSAVWLRERADRIERGES